MRHGRSVTTDEARSGTSRRGLRTVRRAAAAALVLAGATAVAAGAASALGPSGAGTAREQRSAAGEPLALERSGATGAVTIRVAFDSAGRGAFSVSGALSDSGTARTTRSQSGRRIRLTQSLRGSSGTILVRVQQTCGRSRSTWRILRGSGEYAGLTGGGSGTGRVPCTGPPTPLRGVYRGTVTTPTAEPVAAPGVYGGWTAQNERVTFEVLPGGRTLGNIRVERLYATCEPPLGVALEPAFLSTYPITPDGGFTATFGDSTITGRLSGAGATGTIAYRSAGTAPYVCTSGNVSWTASSPPPPLPTALPGNYCGSTAQSRGVCLTLAANRRVTYLRIEAQLDCVFQGERARFEAVMGFAGAGLPLRSNLSFEALGSIEGDAGGEYLMRGTFDTAGKVSGTLSLFRTSYDDQEGRLYTCRDESFGWQAARVR